MAATTTSRGGPPASAGTRRPAFINSGERGRLRAQSLHHRPGRSGQAHPGPKSTRWGTIGFMVAIHALAVVALLPQLVSAQAAVPDSRDYVVGPQDTLRIAVFEELHGIINRDSLLRTQFLPLHA